jgi:hypothetical protein
MMNTKAAALAIALATICGSPADAQPLPPVQVLALPHVVIFSPEFYWSNTPDVMRMASATCPKGRAIGGGLSIRQGNASLRIQDSYPDGASWVVRFAVRPGPGGLPPQNLRVRGFALCLLPVSRDFSVLFTDHPRLLYQSSRIGIAAGGVSATGRQACPEGTLVISGGIGLDAANESSAARLRMELSFPDPHGWNIRAANDASETQVPANARVHSVCIGKAEGVDISKHRIVSFVETDVALKPDGSTLRQSVVCKDPQAYALAGGFRLLRGRNATMELQESFPDTPSSWTTVISNRGKSTATAAVRLYAVCLKP